MLVEFPVLSGASPLVSLLSVSLLFVLSPTGGSASEESSVEVLPLVSVLVTLVAGVASTGAPASPNERIMIYSRK